ncbi:serine/threonine-protein kinase [Streptomyces aurantiacus]|uniref:serine/threonine-protein kinase n=1 Tax=Streptomyces aurantiacus TaxID=47760 RepID=UPI00331CFCBE
MASTGELVAGRYRIETRLGRGGMGTVWRARDELLGRAVAVKELHVDAALTADDAERQQERTLREARSVAQLKHPGILVLHDVVQHPEASARPWLVMELVEGWSLADRMAAEGPLPPAEAGRVGLALLAALRAAHTAGVLHRDLKPANVLLEAETGRVVLSDFGIAQVAGQTTLTQTGAFVGSPEYTAPERMSGRRSGPESDLWSLGVLLCAAVAGTSPFHRDSVAGVLHAVVLDEIRLPDELGPLLPVARGLLERDPEHRLTTSGAEQALRTALNEPAPPAPHAPATTATPGAPATTPAHAHPDPTPARTVPEPLPPARRGARSRPRSRTAVLAGALVAVLAAGGISAGIWLAASDGDEAGAGGGGRTTEAADKKDLEPTAKKSPKGPAEPRETPRPGTSADGSQRTGKPAKTPPPKGAEPPAGYRAVTDPAGFALTVPEGFTRSPEPPRVYYYSPGKRFRIGVHPQPKSPAGPLSTMRKAHADGPSDYPGYRAGSVTRTTHNGHAAALWTFTWNGTAKDGGPRVTYDLSWNENGKMYDLWVSAPAASGPEGKRYFDRALRSFRRTS